VTFENLTLWQRVYDLLREEILRGQLAPDTVLREVALSESLGVSRGPVREALGRLAAEGLVDIRPRRSAVVRFVSRREFLELYQVREALEAMAVRLAAPRLTTEDLMTLAGLTDSMAKWAERGDIDELFEANVAFHLRWVELSGNAKLEKLYRQLLGQMAQHRVRSLTLRGDPRHSIVEHRAVLEAAASGNIERAAELMAEHIRVPQLQLSSLTDEEFRGAEAHQDLFNAAVPAETGRP
jgi:DNA-binding GntR family transcriptional regulator